MAAMSEKSGEIVLKGREELYLTGMREVISFDEQSVHLLCSDGELFIEGNDIKIGTLDSEGGNFSLSGRVDALYFTSEESKEKKGFFGKLLR